MCFEGFKELSQHFILCLLARLHIRVERGVVSAFDIVDVQNTVSRLVDGLKGFDADVSSELAERSDYNANELVEVNGPVVCWFV